jgi:protein-L-isoaspartate(D-aspartate) O-methyltransferase
MTQEATKGVRRWFAEELRHIARVQSGLVIDGFAAVPREHFAGPGPWRILSPMRMSDYWTTEDADPAHLYHDVLVAIDESRGLNNGQPSLWAFLYDELGLARGERILHIGTGSGYYTAILAEIVGSSGQVTGVEIDPHLAALSRANLKHAWPQAKIVNADGFSFRPERPLDVIVVNAGVSHLSLTWLDFLDPQNGRLLVPLTTAGGRGAFVLISRKNGDAECYAAQFVHPTGIIHCVGGRDTLAEMQLAKVMHGAGYEGVRSLRRAPMLPDDSCWLAGEGWWLSTAPYP